MCCRLSSRMYGPRSLTSLSSFHFRRLSASYSSGGTKVREKRSRTGRRSSSLASAASAWGEGVFSADGAAGAGAGPGVSAGGFLLRDRGGLDRLFLAISTVGDEPSAISYRFNDASRREPNAGSSWQVLGGGQSSHNHSPRHCLSRGPAHQT